MPRPRTGTVQTFTRADGRKVRKARITLKDGSRVWKDVPPEKKTKESWKHFAAWLQEQEDTRGLIFAEKQRKAGLPSKGETVKDWCDRWLAWRDEKGLASTANDRGRIQKHVFPALGHLEMATVTKAQIEQLVEALDSKVRDVSIPFAWKTAIHVWGAVTKMFKDACSSKRTALRVRSDNPTTGVEGPDRGTKRSKAYLYPAEFSQLVTCSDVPLEWRRMFAITTYLYARAGEVNALTWDAVDLTQRVVHIHQSVDRETGDTKDTKSGEARRIPIEPELLPLLEAMHTEAGGVGRVVAVSATDRKLSRQLQRCLKLAGVERSDLFVTDATRKAMTFHDLRATGITWCAARGDEPLRIKQRAGHATFSTTEGYIREAENLRESIGEVFPCPGRFCLTKRLTTTPSQAFTLYFRALVWWRRRESKTAWTLESR